MHSVMRVFLPPMLARPCNTCKVFPWNPHLVKELAGPDNLLTGLQIADIPLSCAAGDDLSLFKDSLSIFSGLQKVKVQAHSMVSAKQRHLRCDVRAHL
jgi:hypothetical protein